MAPAASAPSASAPLAEAKTSDAPAPKSGNDPKKPEADEKKPEPDSPKPEAPSAASGDAGPAKNPAQDPIVSTRRAGFTIGLMGSFGVGNITGYPLDVAKRGKTEFQVDTGVAYGGNGSFFLGGAITDWLVFGAGLGGTYSVGKDTVMSGYTFLLHTEVFPLFWLGGIFRETGVALDTGAGQIVGELANKPSGDAGKQVAPVIDSGAASRVAVSLFYDGLRAWKLSAGPFIGFDYTWSPSLDQPLFLVGLRSALYVKAKTK